MGRWLAAVALVAAVALAGCAGLGGDAPRSTPTLTPAAVPTDGSGPSVADTPTPEPRLAPGVTERGVVDPAALAAAHASTLRGTTYALVWTSAERDLNGTLRSRTTTTARVGTGGRYHYVRTDRTASGTRRVERWSDGERVLVASPDGPVSVARGPDGAPLDPEAALPVDLTAERSVERVFRAVETRTAGTVRGNGTVRYRLEGTELREPNPTPLRNATLSAVVDERGVVHSYRLAYTTVRGEGLDPVRVVVTVRFQEIGTATVDRPGWAD